MDVVEFKRDVLSKCKTVVDVGIKNGFFKESDRDRLSMTLKSLFDNGIKTDIDGDAIYGCYRPDTKSLEFNVKKYSDVQEALTYVLHEIKHGLDDIDGKIGFQMKNNEGIGRNEGATQRFATDMAEIMLGERFPEKEQTSLGITLNTKLDEYQLEDKINSLFCEALGISMVDFIRMQNEEDLNEFEKLKEKFNQYADFDMFNTALDGIYRIQEETWFDEQNNFLEQEKPATPKQIERAKSHIETCQQQILLYIEKARPEIFDEIKSKMIYFDGENLDYAITSTGSLISLNTSEEELENNDVNAKKMDDKQMLYQDDYIKYLNFIKQGLDLNGEQLVYVSGLEEHPFDCENDNIKALLENGNVIEVFLYSRVGDEYHRRAATIDKNGISAISSDEIIQDINEIIEKISVSDTLGVPDEYIKLLYHVGNNAKAENISEKYEYFKENVDEFRESKKQETQDDSIGDMISYMRSLLMESDYQSVAMQPESIIQKDSALEQLRNVNKDEKALEVRDPRK